MLPPFFLSSNSGFKVQLALQEKWQNLYGNGVLQNLYGNGVLTLMNNQKESTLSNKVIDEVWIFKQKSWEDIISHLFIVNIDKNERVYQTCFIANKSKDWKNKQKQQSRDHVFDGRIVLLCNWSFVAKIVSTSPTVGSHNVCFFQCYYNENNLKGKKNL